MNKDYEVIVVPVNINAGVVLKKVRKIKVNLFDNSMFFASLMKSRILIIVNMGVVKNKISDGKVSIINFHGLN